MIAAPPVGGKVAAPPTWGALQWAWAGPVLGMVFLLIVLYPFAPKAVSGLAAIILFLVAAQGVRNGKIPFLKGK